uniref:Uncharacterized protein n=1 Tax=Sipha flava TaxID=143950 RepID=A0A2S2QSH5_9HEMI
MSFLYFLSPRTQRVRTTIAIIEYVIVLNIANVIGQNGLCNTYTRAHSCAPRSYTCAAHVSIFVSVLARRKCTCPCRGHGFTHRYPALVNSIASRRQESDSHITRSTDNAFALYTINATAHH